jgi:hypothetical protein
MKSAISLIFGMIAAAYVAAIWLGLTYAAAKAGNDAAAAAAFFGPIAIAVGGGILVGKRKKDKWASILSLAQHQPEDERDVYIRFMAKQNGIPRAWVTEVVNNGNDQVDATSSDVAHFAIDQQFADLRNTITDRLEVIFSGAHPLPETLYLSREAKTVQLDGKKSNFYHVDISNEVSSFKIGRFRQLPYLSDEAIEKLADLFADPVIFDGSFTSDDPRWIVKRDKAVEIIKAEI